MPGRKVSLPSTKLSLPSTSKMSLDARFTRLAYSPYQKLCGQTGRAGIMKEDPRSWSQQTSPSRMKSSVEVREGEVRGMLPVRSWEPRVQAFESDHGLALRRTSENQSQLGLQLRRLSRLEATQEAARVRNSRNRRLLPTVASSTSQCQSRQRPPVLRWGVRQPARTRFWVPGGIRPVNSGLLLPKRKSSVLCDCNRDCECDKKARDLLDCDLEAYMAGRKRDNSLNKIKDSHLNGVKDSPLDRLRAKRLKEMEEGEMEDA